VLSDELLTDKEAVDLRKEVTSSGNPRDRRTSNTRFLIFKVTSLRRSTASLSVNSSSPKEGLVETWLEEGPQREGHMKDDSWVRDI
jgi:monolysocardiolipin acyltransferase